MPQQQRTFAQVRNHLKALEDYTPQPYNGDIVFIQAQERFFRMKNIPLSATWLSLIRGKVAVLDTPGSHLGMLVGAQVGYLAKLLDTSIADRSRQLSC